MTDEPEPPLPTWVPPAPPPVPPPVTTALARPPIPPPGANPYAPSYPVKPGRGPSTLVVVLVIVGVFIVLVVGLIALSRSLVSSVGEFGDPYEPAEPYEPDEPPPPVEPTIEPPAPYPGPGVVGSTLTTLTGVSATLEKFECGLEAAVGTEVRPEGAFCRASLVLLNENATLLELGSQDFRLFGAGTEYPTVPEGNTFADQPGGVFLGANAEADVFVYFDVPVGAAVDQLVYQRASVDGDALTWSLVPGAEAAPPPPPPPAGGLDATVTAVTCGLAEAPDVPRPIEPDGEFCRVDVVVENRTGTDYRVSGADFTLLTADASYTTSSRANRFSYQRLSDWIAPGETDACVLYFDVPPGTSPTGVRFGPTTGSAVTFDVP